MKEDKKTSRREFLEGFGSVLAGITIVGFVSPVLESCYNSPTSSGGADCNAAGSDPLTVSVASLTADGQGVRTTSSKGDPVIIIRRSATTFTALCLVCTHQQCRGNQIQLQSDRLHCTCHGSEYNFDGTVIHGPAPRSLASFPTTFNAAKNEVTVTF
jgi:cytochrome b6-f complex iron-sulfur subunit